MHVQGANGLPLWEGLGAKKHSRFLHCHGSEKDVDTQDEARDEC